MGNHLAIYDGEGNLVTDTTNMGYIANINPIRYRGYYYDVETGFYYLKSRYYDPEVGRFISQDNPDYLGSSFGVAAYNLYAYCNNNPVSFIDPNGRWPEWLETTMKVFAVSAVVVTAALVITGTGGAAAGFFLGVACSAAIGGYFNERAGGSFTAGYIGGAVSGTIQTIAGNTLGPIGLIIGGGAGSGVGTIVTGTLDNLFGSPNQKKSYEQIMKNAAQSAVCATIMSLPTAFIRCASNSVKYDSLGALTEPYTEIFLDVLEAFFGAVDDATAYIMQE